MNDPTRQPISDAAEMETRSELDARLIQESAGKGDTTIHGVPPFTMPMADGTLRASSNIGWSETGNITGMRKRQGEIARSDQDGDGNHTNLNGYRDPGSDRRTDGNDGRSQRKTGALSSGSVTRKSFLQRVRKGFFPILLGIAVGWYYDAIEVLIFRRDPRIKG
ncbi:hypothetical protein BGZ76_009972 [Entomortierella beljakovae]|nr:hypothetical protein BGZ76_009972 [Entomortierella beljakovae]